MKLSAQVKVMQSGALKAGGPGAAGVPPKNRWLGSRNCTVSVCAQAGHEQVPRMLSGSPSTTTAFCIAHENTVEV